MQRGAALHIRQLFNILTFESTSINFNQYLVFLQPRALIDVSASSDAPEFLYGSGEFYLHCNFRWLNNCSDGSSLAGLSFLS